MLRFPLEWLKFEALASSGSDKHGAQQEWASIADDNRNKMIAQTVTHFK